MAKDIVDVGAIYAALGEALLLGQKMGEAWDAGDWASAAGIASEIVNQLTTGPLGELGGQVAGVAQFGIEVTKFKFANTPEEKIEAALGIIGATGTIITTIPGPQARAVGVGINAAATAAKVALKNKDAIGDALTAGMKYSEIFPGPAIGKIKSKTGVASTIPSPLVLDLDGDGVETVGLTEKIHFDHAADGFAEQTGWVAKDDGLLVRDLNGNGKIDSGVELFGSETILNNGQKSPNGFAALAELDSNTDGRVDSSDAAYSTLRIWRDVDTDGITDDGELLTLNETNVKSINLGFSQIPPAKPVACFVSASKAPSKPLAASRQKGRACSTLVSLAQTTPHLRFC